MNAERILITAIYPALDLLPIEMGSPAAMSMLLAIGLQESRFQHRHQIGGPAHGYWQFEQGGGVKGVLTHASTKELARSVLTALDYHPASDAAACYAAIEHNDVLAAAFARLLLFTVPGALPPVTDPNKAWDQYIFGWRPGRPHRPTWDAFFEQGWQVVAEVTKDS